MELELAARTKALDTLRVQRRELSEVVGTGSTSSTSKGKKSVTVSDGIYPSALRT